MKRAFVRAFVVLAAVAGLVLGLGPNPTPAEAAAKHKFALILPGPVEDSDYNYLGYQVVQHIKQRFQIPVSYSERISPADAERVAREYIASGYTIVGFHGGQFIRIIKKLAPKFPGIAFVMESSGKFPNPPNVWNIGRRYTEAFHAFGVLAGMSTKTNKVGVIAGIPLPDFKGSINTIWDALHKTNPKAELIYAFTGDQNDPLKARQTAEAQIAAGVDFIINMVNLGVYGVVEAAKRAKGKVLITTFYTDKSDKAPNHFAGTLLIDFRPPYTTVVQGVLDGKKGGYVSMRPGSGFEIAALYNVSLEAAKRTKALFDKVVRREVVPRFEIKKVRLTK